MDVRPALPQQTMLPYLAATGIIASAELTTAERVAVLAGYCLTMVTPALVLLGLRLVARNAVEPLLQRAARWMERSGGEMTSWVVGIVGVLIALDALERVPELAAYVS